LHSCRNPSAPTNQFNWLESFELQAYKKINFRCAALHRFARFCTVSLVFEPFGYGFGSLGKDKYHHFDDLKPLEFFLNWI